MSVPHDPDPGGVPLLAPDSEPLRALLEHGIEPAHLYRALANQPVLLDAWLDFARTLRSESTTPRALRELLILRSAVLTGARYVWSDHVPMALAAGVTHEKIAALAAGPQAPLWSDVERVALTLVDQIALQARATDHALSALDEHFTAAERVELALTVGFYSMVPRVLAALRVPLPARDDLEVPFPESVATGDRRCAS